MADEHIRASVIRGLRDRGIEVRTATDQGLQGASDRALFEHCRDRGWVLLTNDDDLLRLAGPGEHPGGLFQTTQFVAPGVLLRAVVRLVDTLPQEAWAGCIHYVP